VSSLVLYLSKFLFSLIGVKRGPIQVARSVVQEKGVLGLWSGIRPLWARDIPFNTLFFGTYELIQKVNNKKIEMLI